MTACVLLAGGLGTRLRPAVAGIPKCLAPVGGRPFLQIQMERLSAQGVRRFVLSLGYLAAQVIDVARALRESFAVEWLVEPVPLGTGGATLFALQGAGLAEALVANADTFVDADLGPLLPPLDRRNGERLRMGVVHAARAVRSGAVVVHGARVLRFLPQGAPGPGLISAGLYRIHRGAFAARLPGQAFSLETDVIEGLARQGGIAAAHLAGTFVDIGVPEDYRRFCDQVAPCR